MKIKRITLRNFLSHASTDIEFGEQPLWLIVGPNGAGKSALFDAIEFTLFGYHRSGKQNFVELIKKDEDEAEVIVEFAHDGTRYKASRKLSRKTSSGNVGGSLAVQDASGGWQPVSTASDGRQAVWDYVEESILPRELFESAVYLKQGNIDFFLSGSSTDRGKRFARLLNLARYEEVAEAARQRKRSAKETARIRRGDISELGDVSESRIASLKAEEARLGSEISVYQSELEVCQQQERDAGRWKDKSGELEEIKRNLANLQALLDEQPKIEEAHKVWKSWQTSEKSIEQFWDATLRAESADQEAAGKTAKAREARIQADAMQPEIDERKKSLSELNETHLPEARQEVGECKSLHGCLDLEKQIAERIESLEKARQTQGVYAGAEQQYNSWVADKTALPRLKAIATARDELEDTKAAVERLQAVNQQAIARLETAKKQVADAEAKLPQLKGQVIEAERRLGRLDDEKQRLQLEVAKHKQLEVGLDRCPVCNRTLDEDAHSHVQHLISQKQTRLAEIENESADANQHVANAKDDLRRATDELREMQEAKESVEDEGKNAEVELSGKSAEHQRAQKALDRAISQAHEEAPQFAEYIDDINSSYTRQKQSELAAAEAQVQEQYKVLGDAQADVQRLINELDTLRDQRKQSSVRGMGDDLPVEKVEDELHKLKARETAAEDRLKHLEAESECLTNHLRELEKMQVGSYTAAGSLEQQAEEARRTKDTELEAASQSAAAVPGKWQHCLETRHKHEEQQVEILEAKSWADKWDQLTGALSQRDVWLGQQDKLQAELAAIPENARVPATEVAERIQNLETQISESVIRKQTLHDELVTREANLESRQRYQRELELAEQDSWAFGELYKLLRPGGEIQLRVIQSVQEEIRQQANDVLDRLSDSLEIRLGAPMRGNSASLDVTVRDRRDPSAGERYYEFLSGGEKFRVALAMALAIHYRATGQSAGTIIIDEGFGALDDERRTAVAELIAEVSQGLLEQQLVEQIIVATHATDVRTLFPHRLEITKSNGRATVSRVSN